MLIDGSRNQTGRSCAWMSVKWSSVTCPGFSKCSSPSFVMASPASAVPGSAAASAVRKSRRVSMSVADAGDAQRQPIAERGEIELDVAVFGCVGRQLLSADGDVAPFEALADIPDLLAARAPSREGV